MGILLEKFKTLSKRNRGVFEKCKFYGEILTEHIPDFYSRLDIFVLASRDETFGVCYCGGNGKRITSYSNRLRGTEGNRLPGITGNIS